MLPTMDRTVHGTRKKDLPRRQDTAVADAPRTEASLFRRMFMCESPSGGREAQGLAPMACPQEGTRQGLERARGKVCCPTTP